MLGVETTNISETLGRLSSKIRTSVETVSLSAVPIRMTSRFITLVENITTSDLVEYALNIVIKHIEKTLTETVTIVDVYVR